MEQNKIITLQQIATEIENHDFDREVFTFDLLLDAERQTHFPLRIDGMLVGICTEGEATIGIDLTDYRICRNSLFVIQPRNYIHSGKIDVPCRFKVFACTSKMLESLLPTLTDLLPVMLNTRTRPVIGISPEEAEGLLGFYSFLSMKLAGAPTKFLPQKVVCVLQAALYELIDIHYAYRGGMDKTFYKSRKEEIMARFIISVGENFRKSRQVSFYANDLCISPKHLSSVVKEISGRTAGEWIDSYVIMEAKILLRNTDFSIQHIANMLNFANQSFFGKYFRFQTGVSPTEFRKSILP